MNRAESEMTRYMRRLADRDLALDRAMIPLGSCTMKLNATAEMLPISWPEFSEIHPFVPADQARGYHELIADLSAKLCAITGYDAISMQPNSGAQGEYAGLLAIRAYHLSRGEGHRDICLIPSSAHGTNPASAQMCGMSVVVVGADRNGNIDIDDFRAKAEQHSGRLAACMITYPSTHGVFEGRIREICDIVHAHGGQVYLDGANLNALVGLARPGDIGADVSHLNLHKTFCIPHGGGGPGMGPIGVKAHLIPFLPGDPETGERGRGLGRALWLGLDPADLLELLPADGRPRADPGDAHRHPQRQLYRQASRRGVPGALQRDAAGASRTSASSTRVPCAKSAGITVDDIAKRLIDCGFHPPTMSWPVAGTLMIEPTESETKGGDRPLLRRHAGDPRGNPRHRGGPHGPAEQPAQERAPHRAGPDRRLGPPLLPGGRLLSDRNAAQGQILAAHQPGRQCLRRPQPDVQLPASGDLHQGGRIDRSRADVMGLALSGEG